MSTSWELFQIIQNENARKRPCVHVVWENIWLGFCIDTYIILYNLNSLENMGSDWWKVKKDIGGPIHIEVKALINILRKLYVYVCYFYAVHTVLQSMFTCVLKLQSELWKILSFYIKHETFSTCRVDFTWIFKDIKVQGNKLLGQNFYRLKHVMTRIFRLYIIVLHRQIGIIYISFYFCTYYILVYLVYSITYFGIRFPCDEWLSPNLFRQESTRAPCVPTYL